MTKDLDERLAAYYGSPLREQPLSHASWQSLRRRLKRRNRPRLKSRLPINHRRARPALPLSVLEAYTRVVHDAHTTLPPVEPRSVLRCTFVSSLRDPAVRVSFLNHPAVMLMLPRDRQSALGNDALDVLVATGIARHRFVSAPSYQLMRLFLLLLVLIGCIAVPLSGLHRLLLPGIAAAILLCACSILLLGLQLRKIALAADLFVVQWLGRERTCRGLHALADLSRSPSRRTWGEPSLTERIERVCGTHIQSHDEHLTLVR